MSKEIKTSNSIQWKMTPEELDMQVKGYKTLPFFETRRGLAASLVAAIIVFSTVAAFVGWTQFASGEDALWSLLIFVPVIFFIGKGYRWAILLFALVWTAEKIIQIYIPLSHGDNPSGLPLLWWFIVMPFLYKALTVENVRRRRENP